MKTFNCKHCGDEKAWSYSTTNTYCSNRCQVEYEWKNHTKPLIEAGKKGIGNIRALRRYVIERDGEVCSECRLPPVWREKVLSLHLDHIDGNSDNNLPENLRLLCPNCHSQTETYGSKGQGSRYKKITKRNGYLREYKGRLV